MRKLLQNKAVVSALSVVAVASVAGNFVKLPKATVQNINARQPTPTAAPTADNQVRIRGQVFSSLASQQWRSLYPIEPSARNPFAMPLAPTTSSPVIPKREVPRLQPSFRLQATSMDGSVAFAVINQSVVREGEMIAGYLVELIRPLEVRLSGPHGAIVIDLNQSMSTENPATENPPNADLPAASSGSPVERVKPLSK